MDIFTTVNTLLSSKNSKEDWVREAVPVLIEINRQIKTEETAMTEESEPFKLQLKSISDKYQVALKPLSEMDTRLRERLLKEYPSTEAIPNPEGVGKVVFAETWGYEIEDIKKVDKNYKIEVIDTKKVKGEIKKGVRNIKGLKIASERSMRVYTKEEAQGEEK